MKKILGIVLFALLIGLWSNPAFAEIINLNTQVDSLDVQNGALSVNDVANGGNGFVTKPTVDDSLLNYGISRGTKKRLQVRGAVGTDDSLLVLRSSLGKTVASVDSLGKLRADSLYVAGSVGFGTVNPTERLHVTSNKTSNYQVLFENTHVDWPSGLGLKSANNTWSIVSQGGGQNGAFTVYDETASTSPFRIEKTSPTNTIYVKSTGKIGIGTSIPADSSLTLGQSDTQRDLVITREKTPANTDSSFKATIASGYPSLIGYGGDASTSNITWAAGDVMAHVGATGGYTFDAPVNLQQKTYIIDADSTIGATQSGNLFIARPLTAKRTITLPTAAANLVYEFMVADTDSLLITAASGDSLITFAGAAWKTTSSVSGTLKLVAIDTVRWIMQYSLGTWTSY